MLAQFLERQKNWQEALEHYREVPPEDQRFAASPSKPSPASFTTGCSPRSRKRIRRSWPSQPGNPIPGRISQNPPDTLTANDQGRNALAISRYVLCGSCM